MKTITSTMLAGLLLAALAGTGAYASTLVIGDDYNVANSGTGFNLGSGANSGINPPTTRLTGTAAAGLRYIKAYGPKANSAFYITNSAKLNVNRVASDSATLSLSTGTGEFDFGPILNSLGATPSEPATYELTIKMSNGAGGSQRCSFAISSTAGTANAWDFAIQIYHVSGDTAYTLQKRVNTTAGGLASVLNSAITTVGTYPNEVSFLIRVTDAGAETDTFSSRVEVAFLDGSTTNWVYDTSTDTFDLPYGWRFPGSSRYIYWDIAGGAGPVTYDDFTMTWLSGPTSGPRTWTGGGADGNWSTSANWGGVAPGTGDSLIFNGTVQQVNTNDITDLSVPRVTFNNDGFSLYGNVLTIGNAVTNAAGTNTFAGDLAWTGSAIKYWNIATGSEVVLDNTTAVEVNGDHTLTGGGVLRLKGTNSIGISTTANPAFNVNQGQHIIDGGNFTSRGGYRIASSASAAGGGQTIISNGATFALTVPGANLRVGDSANPATSRLIVDNSSLTMGGGSLGIPYAAGATGEVSQVGGLVSGAILNFNQNGAGMGTYTVQNGTVEPWQIKRSTAGGQTSISFDNVVLRAPFGASNDFFSGVDAAEIQAGGLVIDAQADVTIAQGLSGAGALVKSNYAAVMLTGANSYSGTTTVQAGKLGMAPGQTYSGAIQVDTGAELNVAVQAPGATLNCGAVTLGNSTLSFDLGAYSTPTVPLMKVSTLSPNGSVSIRVANGLSLTTGQVVLVDYDSLAGSGFGAFSLDALPTGVQATLVNNTANGSIDLNITGVPGYRWTGASSSDWDYSTANWISLETGAAAAYADGFPTAFLDGAARGDVNLAISPLPAVMTVSNNLLPYVFSGSGGIITPTLKKSGTNSLTRLETAADQIGTLELNEGSFVASNDYYATWTTVLEDTTAGLGTLVKDGVGTLVLSTNSDFDGAIVVKNGVLTVGAVGALGSTNGSTTVLSGATLDVNDIQSPHEPVFVSGTGYAGQGAITELSGAGGVQHNLTDVTLMGDTSFGCVSGGRWDIRVRTGSGPDTGLKGNGYNLTKIGPGNVSIACQRHNYGVGVPVPYWEMNLGDVLINEGELTFAESLTLGNPSKALTVATGASLGVYDLNVTNPILRTVVLNDAQISARGSTGDTNVFDGNIQITGSALLRPTDTILIVNGNVIGTGSLNVLSTGVGTLFLNGTNTFPGDTTVTNGVFGGSGSLAGNLVMLDGTLSPGWGVGSMTVSGNVTLAGTTLMELAPGQSPNSDRLVAGGAITAAGTLVVTLPAGAATPASGDVYQLFNKPLAGGFASNSLPTLPLGLSWDISQLAANGTISVTGTVAQPMIGAVGTSGGNLVFSGTGGVEGASYRILSSGNVAAPIANWAPVATNTFGAGGTFTATIPIDAGTPAAFFRLVTP